MARKLEPRYDSCVPLTHAPPPSVTRPQMGGIRNDSPERSDDRPPKENARLPMIGLPGVPTFGRDCQSPSYRSTALASTGPQCRCPFEAVRLHRWEHWLRAFERFPDDSFYHCCTPLIAKLFSRSILRPRKCWPVRWQAGHPPRRMLPCASDHPKRRLLCRCTRFQ
jgi:hypothetical protein